MADKSKEAQIAFVARARELFRDSIAPSEVAIAELAVHALQVVATLPPSRLHLLAIDKPTDPHAVFIAKGRALFAHGAPVPPEEEIVKLALIVLQIVSTLPPATIAQTSLVKLLAHSKAA